MKKILFILLFLFSFLGATDSNSTIQTVIDNIAVESSIANNEAVNGMLSQSVDYFIEHELLFVLLVASLLLLFYYSNKWIRVFIGLFIFHILYQSLGISLKFPTIDIMYYGFATWNISLILRSFHKYFKQFENKNLVTKVNLFLHIIDILIFILTLAFVIHSFDIKNIEVITTGIGVALFIIVRKDLNNLKSFFIVSWDKFLSIGDKIIVGSHEGRILYINKFTTILQSDNGNIMKIPNSDLLENLIINKSKNKNHIKQKIE